jgi:phytanoyl-CoA hydroxylase
MIKKSDLLRDGFIKIEALVAVEELNTIRTIVYEVVDGKRGGVRRIELLPSNSRRNEKYENITNIPNLSRHFPQMRDTYAYQDALAFVQSALGSDMQLAFDMIFFKGPYTRTPTPFHQDAAYWPPLKDERAAQCWIALDDTDIENGCLWFVPSSHRGPLRDHTIVDDASGLSSCLCCEDEAIPVPLKAGSCTFHLGRTIHYSRGNDTSRPRCAIVITFRPQSEILV